MCDRAKGKNSSGNEFLIGALYRALSLRAAYKRLIYKKKKRGGRKRTKAENIK